MYYPCSENKGADHLCSYCTADLRLCFRIGKNPLSSNIALMLLKKCELEMRVCKTLCPQPYFCPYLYDSFISFE